MATYPRGDLIVLATPTRYDADLRRVVAGKPLESQPTNLDDREPPDGHYGVMVRYPNGDERGWYPPAAPPAPRPRALTKFEFLNLFTPEEIAAAIALKATTLAVFWLYYEAAEMFERDHPSTVAGLAALVAAEVIDTARRDEILAAWPTS